jgi:hypothetical protein
VSSQLSKELTAFSEPTLLELEDAALELARLAGAEITNALGRTLALRYKKSAKGAETFRMAAAADKRADLDLQISLLAEHEVTRLVTLVSGIADRMGVKTEADADVEEIALDVAPEAVLDELEETKPEAEQH